MEPSSTCFDNCHRRQKLIVVYIVAISLLTVCIILSPRLRTVGIHTYLLYVIVVCTVAISLLTVCMILSPRLRTVGIYTYLLYVEKPRRHSPITPETMSASSTANTSIGEWVHHYIDCVVIYVYSTIEKVFVQS